MKKLTPLQKEKFVKNLKRFTFPLLAMFFGQLAMGVDPKAAGLITLYALYAAVSDYFNKTK